VALRDGLLQAQAQVAGPDQLDEHSLLFWNRSLPLVRFAHTGAGEVYVKGEVPVAAVDPAMLDRFLGLLVRTATMARERLPSPYDEGRRAQAERAGDHRDPGAAADPLTP
jgi:Putative bacterial sensory transduction regulator